ncbi:MAG: hypothetical protein C5B51_05695 [Terriglobia bacterium]|nr:MAG: hypothetical protein C5B51_05695 [Terriglobia bacterium]
MRPPNPEYLRLIARYDEPVRKLALAARKLILEEAPQASELIYEVYTIAAHFTFTGKAGDAFVFTTTHTNWVNLGFNYGSLLPDPQKRLQGEGKWIRHVRISKPGDLEAPGVRELVGSAIAVAERGDGKKKAAGASVVRTKASASRSRRT